MTKFFKKIKDRVKKFWRDVVDAFSSQDRYM